MRKPRPREVKCRAQGYTANKDLNTGTLVPEPMFFILFMRDSGPSSESALTSFDFCGRILQAESRARLLPGPTVIRSSVLPESHSFLGFSLFLKVPHAKWRLVCLQQEHPSLAPVSGEVTFVAIPFWVQLSTLCMLSWCPKPPSSCLPRRASLTPFRGSLSSSLPGTSQHPYTNPVGASLEGENSTFIPPTNFQPRLHTPLSLPPVLFPFRSSV